MHKKTLRQDNAGISLLELVVAVSIFMILALILFRGFVSSARLNKKSGTYLSATTIAQNIMEEIKAKTFAQTALAFNYPVNPVTKENRFGFLQEQQDISGDGTGEADGTGSAENTDSKTTSVVTKELLKTDNTYKSVRLYEDAGKDADKVTSSILSTDGGKTYTFKPRTKGTSASKYYFSMEGIKNQNNTFDALVEFDGSKSSGYKKSASSKKTGKNDYLMPNIAKLDTEKNAFLIMDQDWDENAMQTMIKEQLATAQQKYREEKPAGVAEPKELNYADVYANTKRILEIKVTKEAGVVTAKARYTLWTYNYSNSENPYETMSLCPCHGANLGKSQSDPDWVPGCFCTYVSAYTAFYSSEAGNNLEGIYVFYYPNYKSTSSVNPLDEIVVDNTDNLKFDLYVTKQIPMTENSKDGTDTTESTGTTGNTEGTTATGDDAAEKTESTDKTYVKSLPTSTQEANYRMSLTIKENPTARGNANWNTNLGLYRAQIQLRSNLNYDISNLTQSSRPKLSQMKLTYKEVNGSSTKKASGNSAQTVLDFNSLDDKEAYDRIYSAKISIYKAGAAKKNFPDEDKILSLDGSKEN